MKKFKYLLLIIIGIFIPVFTVNASGGVNVSTYSLTIERGSSKQFTIKGTNVAGVINIRSENGGIASVNKNQFFLDTSLGTSSTTVTVKGNQIGSTRVQVILEDVATFDSEVLSNTININVNVVEPAPKPTTEPTTAEPYDVSKFEVVGYDIEFDKDKTDYSINVSPSVKQLYVIVEGTNLTSNAGIIDIVDKDSIDIIVKHYEETYTYTIKLVKEETTTQANVEETNDDDKTAINNKIKGFKIAIIASGIVILLLISFLIYTVIKNNKKTV